MSEISPTTQPAPWLTVRGLLILQATIVLSILPYYHWGQLGLPASILLALFGFLILREPSRLVTGIVSAFLLIGLLYVSITPFTVPAWRGLLGSIPLALLGIWAWHKRDGLVTGTVFVMAMAMILFAFVMTRPPRPGAVTAQCSLHMKQFALAIENYRAVNGHYPPPYTTDENGKPLHSWRVLLLPYLDQKHLYEKIDLTKPWHHPKNLALADPMPEIFRCPQYRREVSQTDLTTAYVAIVGDHTAWPRTGKRVAEDFIDGPSSTILLVESEKHRIHWMSTADPGIETLGPTDGDGETLLAHGPHQGECVCAFCDGAIRAVWPSYGFEDFLSLLTIDGGEKHKIPDWQENPRRR